MHEKRLLTLEFVDIYGRNCVQCLLRSSNEHRKRNLLISVRFLSILCPNLRAGKTAFAVPGRVTVNNVVG